MRETPERVLRELRSNHSLTELNPEQRQELWMFCDKWNDILANLTSLSDFTLAKREDFTDGSKET